MNLMAYCAALPYFLYMNDFKKVKKIIKIVTVSDLSLKYALSKLYLIDFSIKRFKNPISKFVKKYENNSYFKNVIKGIKKIKKLKNLNSHCSKKLGMACSYPGTFNSSIHSILNSKNYKSAILKTIKAGGCNCSRVNFIGAYFAALNGFGSIPKSWIKKTLPAKKILKQSN